MLNTEELLMIKGGGLTITLLNSIARLMNTLNELGRSLGTSIRMIFGRKVCE